MFRILLVEDSAPEREQLRELLEHRGAHVTEAATDTAAYAALSASNHEDFDLLLTGVNLGVGTTGFDVARAARRAIPELPIVYMTACPGIDMAAHALEGSLSLRKPARLSELADQVLDYVAARRRGETSAPQLGEGGIRA